MTISELSEQYETLIDKDEKLSISARDIVRLFRAHQRALNEKLVLEARIASLEMQLSNSKPYRHIIYG